MILPLKKNTRFSLFSIVNWLILGCLIAFLLTSLIYYILYSRNNILYLDIFSPDNVTLNLYGSYQNQAFDNKKKIDLDLKPGRHHYQLNTYHLKFDQFYFEIADGSEKPIPLSQINTHEILHKKIFQSDINFIPDQNNIFQAQAIKENSNDFPLVNSIFEYEYKTRIIQENDILGLLDKITLCILLLSLFSIKNKRYSISLAIIIFSSIIYWLHFNSTTLNIVFETSQNNQMRVYWKTAKEDNIFNENKSSAYSYQSGLNNFEFRLNNLNNINDIRIDPSYEKTESKIYSIQLSEPGYKTIETGSHDNFSLIYFDDDDSSNDAQSSISNGYLQLNPQIDDPFLLLKVKQKKNKTFFYFINITGFILVCIYLCTRLLPQKATYYSHIIKKVPIIIFLYILYMANFSWYDAHPDEQAHIASVNYYTEYTDPPKVGDSRTTLTYQYPWGISRLDNLGISYLFFGKFKALLSEISNNSTFNARAFNCLLFGLLTLFCLRNRKFAFYCLPLFCIPQVWYLFSYTNRGGFALFIAIFIGWQLVNKKSKFNQYLEPEQKILNPLALPSGILVGLLMIEQTNYLSFILFALTLVIYQFLQIKKHRRQFIKKIAFIIGITIMIVGIRYGYDVSINGFNKLEQQIALAEKIAAPEFKPSIAGTDKSYEGLRLFEKGTQANELFNKKWDWHGLTFKSFTGLYGGIQRVFSAEWYYDSVITLYFFILSVLLFDLFKHPKKSKTYLFIITLAFTTLSIIMGFLFSWLYDYQPQGRYIFPLIPILMVYFQLAAKQWSQNTRRYLRAFALLLMLLSSYTFRITALPFLVDIEFFNHFIH